MQANIFFMITAISVVIVTVFVAVALYHLIRILRAVRDIVERVREGSEMIAEDVANVREGIVTGRFFTTIVSRATEAAGFGRRRSPRPKKKREHAVPVSDEEGGTHDVDSTNQ